MPPAEQKRICFDSYAIFCFDRKDTKSNPLTRKTAHKRLNINHFKERLVHFNGTVVILGRETYVSALKTHVSGLKTYVLSPET